MSIHDKRSYDIYYSLQAMSLLPMFPCLEELYLGNNSIQDLSFEQAESLAAARLEVQLSAHILALTLCVQVYL